MPAPLARVRTPLAWIAGLALAGTPLAAAAALAQETEAPTRVLVSDVEGVFEIDGDVPHDGDGDWDWSNYPESLQSTTYDNGAYPANCSQTGTDATIFDGGTKADDYPFEPADDYIISGQMHGKDDLCVVRQAIQTVVTADDDATSYQHLYHVMITLLTGKGDQSALQFLPAGAEGPEGDLMLELDYDSAGPTVTTTVWVHTDGAWVRYEGDTSGFVVDFAAGVRPESDGEPFQGSDSNYLNTALEYTLDLSALDREFDLYPGDDYSQECISYAPGDFASVTGEGADDVKTPQMKDVLRNDWTIETCEDETPPVTTEPETTEPETTEPETTSPETTQPETTQPETTEPATPLPSETEPAETTASPLPETGGAFDYGLLAGALAITGIGALLALRRRSRDAQ